MLFAGFGVFEDDAAGVGEFEFAGVDDLGGDDVVFGGEGAEVFFPGVVGGEEVGDEDDEGAVGDALEGEVECGGEVGAGADGLFVEDVADDAEGVGAAFACGEVLFDLVGEEAEADFVAVVLGAEGEDGGDFGGAFAFGVLAAAVVAGAGDVDEEHDGKFAFFNVFANVGVVHPGGDVPVDEAGVVAGLVFAEVVELDALAFEPGVVGAAEGFFDEATGEEFDAPDPLEDAGESGVVVFLNGGGHELESKRGDEGWGKGKVEE